MRDVDVAMPPVPLPKALTFEVPAKRSLDFLTAHPLLDQIARGPAWVILRRATHWTGRPGEFPIYFGDPTAENCELVLTIVQVAVFAFPLPL
jgi:hypothetical protein